LRHLFRTFAGTSSSGTNNDSGAGAKKPFFLSKRDMLLIACGVLALVLLVLLAVMIYRRVRKKLQTIHAPVTDALDQSGQVFLTSKQLSSAVQCVVINR